MIQASERTAPQPKTSQQGGDEDVFDLLVIGGGVNGCGVARDAAGRGLRVALVEQDDLAAWTSSASTKLIHGGLRYLEYYAFRLVREALQERERLLTIAPHIIQPLRFVLPHEPGLRPAWLIRAGLFLYDRLGGRSSLPGARGIRLDAGPEGAPLQSRLRRGFTYYDCTVDDSRLVILNAMDAAERGASIWTRTRLTAAVRRGDVWEAELQGSSGQHRVVRARAMVNAAGPWVSQVLHGALGSAGPEHLRLVKGSHIAVPALYDGDHAYLFQNRDGRIVFAIPWRNGLTLIGTTDVPFDGDPATVAISEAEIAYLCASASEYFTRPVRASDVVATFSGVRPLYDDAAASASAVTRDYVLGVEGAVGEPPVLSVFGGKITTYRRLAEHALEKLAPWLPCAGAQWTATAPLPGGDLVAPGTRVAGASTAGAFAAFAQFQAERYAFLPPDMLQRMAHAYGTRMDLILAGRSALADLGEHFGVGLYAAEVDYLAVREWARTADDVLWRRTRLGLAMPAEGKHRLEAHLAHIAEQEGRAHA